MDIIIYYLINAVTIIIVTTLFEFIKASVSTLQGDTLPKNQGKLTLNPVKSFEPIGFLLFLFTGYGWANPTETSSRNYKDRKIGTIITYTAPILISVILAIVFKAITNMVQDTIILGYLSTALYYLARNFAAIAVFNILPVYPMWRQLDFKMFLSPNSAIKYGGNMKNHCKLLLYSLFCLVGLHRFLIMLLTLLFKGRLRYEFRDRD